MRVQRVAMVATAALLGSLALSACSGSATGSVTAGGQSSVSASGAAGGSASSAPGASGTTTGSSTGGGSSSGATGGGSTSVPTSGGSGSGTGGSTSVPTGGGKSGGGSAAPRCATANLGFSIGPDSGPQSVGDTTAAEVVKLTNKGGSSCAMDGFPGVDLRTNYGTISVPRSKQAPQLVTLSPGASALFDIDYTVNNTGGSGVRVETMVITPPNETHSATLAWSVGTLPVTDGSGSMIQVDPVVSFAD